jgi:hypothetical protein
VPCDGPADDDMSVEDPSEDTKVFVETKHYLISFFYKILLCTKSVLLNVTNNLMAYVSRATVSYTQTSIPS